MKKASFLRLTALAGTMFASMPGTVHSGTVFGNGGATEVTQIMNNVQLILQYEQQVQAYVRQGLQLQNELKNLAQNPASLVGSDIGNVIRGVGQVMSGGMSIGNSVAQIDKNFATTFKSPTAQTLSKNFFNWHKTSTDTLEGALKAAGMHRDQFDSETDAITALYNESQASGGNLQALQTLAKINTRQLQQNQALQDLLTSQNIASSTYMASQNAKAQNVLDNDEEMQKGIRDIKPSAPPTLDTSTRTYKAWNLYKK